MREHTSTESRSRGDILRGRRSGQGQASGECRFVPRPKIKAGGQKRAADAVGVLDSPPRAVSRRTPGDSAAEVPPLVFQAPATAPLCACKFEFLWVKQCQFSGVSVLLFSADSDAPPLPNGQQLLILVLPTAAVVHDTQTPAAKEPFQLLSLCVWTWHDVPPLRSTSR